MKIAEPEHIRRLRVRGSMRTIPVVRPVGSNEIRRTPPRAGNAGRFVLHLHAGDASAAGPATGAASPTGLAALLEVQQIELDGGGAPRAALRRGSALLDRLDDLRVALLTGRISSRRLQALAETLREEDSLSGDEAVDMIIADIKLRAEVEIAKFETAGHFPERQP
jgi:hypothetical protein